MPTDRLDDSGMARPSEPSVLVVPLSASYRGWLGGVHYVQNLLRILDASPEGRRPSVYVFDDAPGEWPDAMVDACSLPVVKAVIGPQGVIIRAAADPAGRFPSQAAPPDRRRMIAQAAEAILPMSMAEPALIRTPRHWAWIPDLQHKRLPAMFGEAERNARDALCQTLADRDGPVILSSRSALFDFQEFFPGHRARAYVWSFVSTISTDASAPVPDVLDRYGLSPGFLYLPNQFWVHKDHRTAFEAVRLLRDQGVAIVLACTGGAHDYRSDGHFETLFQTVRAHGLDARIRYLGVIPQADQIALLRACAAVVQPSLFEGWSTVVEDARAVGCPLIVSDIAVHREQLGTEGVFFRAGDPGDLAKVVVRTLSGLAPERGATAEQAARDVSLARRQACVETLLDHLDHERAARIPPPVP